MGFIFVFFAQLACSQNPLITEKELEDFKLGTFLYKDGCYKGGKITRTKKWQIEKYPGLEIKFRIDWVSDFEYHLTFVKVSDKSSKFLLGKVIKVKLLEAEDGGEAYTVVVQNDSFFDIVTLERTYEEKSEGRIFSFMK